MSKISTLNSITAAQIAATTDVVPIADISATETKKATPEAIVEAGKNGAFRGTVTMSSNLTVEGGGLRDVDFNDVDTMTLDASTLNLYGVRAISLSSTGVGASQGQVEIRADQQLTLLTPNQVAGTATVGQALKLVDATTGEVEFGDVSATGALRYDTAQSLTTEQVNRTFNNLKQQQVAFLLKKGIINAGIASVARTSNVATITTNAAHGMIVGQKVSINAVTDGTFTASDVAVISVPTSTSFTYASTGSNKAQTADTGTLNTWEVVNDSGHAPWGNARISSISGSTITITFDALPAGVKVLSGTIGNHSNSSGGAIVPYFGAIGATTISFNFRQRRIIHGRVYWNGTTTGGGITSNNNWVKEGDAESAAFVASTINALVIGHSSSKLTTSGSRGASSWVPPVLSGPAGIRPVLPNYQISPFTAAGYQPSETGFYIQFANVSTGAIMDQTALEALSPASTVQVVWSREVDLTVADVTAMPFSVTVWAHVTYLIP